MNDPNEIINNSALNNSVNQPPAFTFVASTNTNSKGINIKEDGRYVSLQKYPYSAVVSSEAFGEGAWNIEIQVISHLENCCHFGIIPDDL